MDGLQKFRNLMTSNYECKVDCIGVGKNDPKQLRVLGRVITIGEMGVTYEPDQRHAEAVCRDLGIQGSNSCATPWEKEASVSGEAARSREKRKAAKKSDDDDDKEEEVLEELQGEEKTKYQSLSARLNYLALDRPDIQYGVKELMRKMSKPEADDVKALKRVARYLIGVPRLGQVFHWQRRPREVRVYVDSDFAGCHKTRKSTSGGAVTWGNGTLKTWSKTQTVIALSTGEAELAAIVKGSTEALGIKSLLEDFGISVNLTICSDASAAIGMVGREGLGKVRHLAVADLWVQAKRATGELTFVKVDGSSNPADALTKGVSGEKLARDTAQLGFVRLDGRSALTPRLT
jgi:hypothetical protein